MGKPCLQYTSLAVYAAGIPTGELFSGDNFFSGNHRKPTDSTTFESTFFILRKLKQNVHLQTQKKNLKRNNTLRGGAVVARWAHNPKVVGSNPTPATKKKPYR